MKLFSLRKRRPLPRVEPSRISPEDRLIAALAGYTPEQWEGISILAKVDAREEFYQTRGLAS